MSGSADRPVAPAPKGGKSAGRRAGIGIVVLVVVVFAAWFSISVLPRWWAHRVGDQVHGDLTNGAILGFMYGFFAMLLPLAVLAAVFRFRRRSVKAWVIGGVIALVLASPNLVTLGIALGRGGAAQAADTTLDVEAPYFRGGMAVGAGVALALAAYFLYASSSRRRARRRAADAEQRAKTQRATPPKGTA